MSAEHEDGLFTPEGFEADHDTMMYAADRLNGGGDFVDANATRNGNPDDNYEGHLPAVATDPRMKELNADGTSDERRRQLADELVRDYQLDTITDRVIEHAAQFKDADREGRTVREARVAQLLMNIGLADIRGTEAPSYEDTVRTITNKDPEPIDPQGLETEERREQFMEMLSRRGIHVSNGKTREQAIEEWEKEMGVHDTSNFEQFQATLREMGLDFNRLLKEALVEADPSFFKDLNLEGLTYIADGEMPYDAFLGFHGAGKGVYKWNSNLPASKAYIQAVTHHEGTHFAQAVAQDQLRRAGRLGPEAKYTTMASAMALQTEGLAQVAPLLVSGGTLNDVADQFGVDYAAVMARDSLQDLVRQWVGEQVAKGKDCSELVGTIRNDFLQDEHIGEKYTRQARDENGKRKKKSYFAENRVGRAYGLAYPNGARAFRQMIANHGVQAVTRSAFYLDGFVDIPGMQQKLARNEVQAF